MLKFTRNNASTWVSNGSDFDGVVIPTIVNVIDETNFQFYKDYSTDMRTQVEEKRIARRQKAMKKASAIADDRHRAHVEETTEEKIRECEFQEDKRMIEKERAQRQLLNLIGYRCWNKFVETFRVQFVPTNVGQGRSDPPSAHQPNLGKQFPQTHGGFVLQANSGNTEM